MPDVIERRELIQPEPATAFAALLEVPLPDLAADEGLPLTWHWLYLLERPRQADLGIDGHPTTGTVPEPPGPGLRRMWAGGQLKQLGTLRCGEWATRRSAAVHSEEKNGRSGPFTVVTVEHQILQRDAVVIEERQDIVYRQAAAPSPTLLAQPESAPAMVPPGPADWTIPVTPTLLFRYSALTYNAHRIHYDRDYARDTEGYPALVTHGPLQVMAMAEAVRRVHGAIAVGETFAYRLVSPHFEHQSFIVGSEQTGVRIETSVRDETGRHTARGTVDRS